MSKLFDKLNLKYQLKIRVVNSPASFEWELATLTGVNVLRATLYIDKQSLYAA